MDVQTESSSRKLMGPPKPPGTQSTSRRKCICISVAAVALGLGLLFLILGLTVFKAKHPVTTINSITLDNLEVGLDVARLRVMVNVTLDVDASVKNPNRVGFRYSNSTTIVRHRGTEIGVAPIPAGRIGARKTKSLNLTLTLMADRMMADPSLYSDVISGTLPLQTYIRISGKVRILFNIHVVAYSTCDVDIDLGNRTLSNMECHYKTKL